MTEQTTQTGDLDRVSNAEVRERWKIDPATQPQDRPLASLDPGNGDWFEQDKELAVFERLRQEAPVHLTEESQFGRYWSITEFNDVKYVDTHQHIFPLTS